MQQVEKLCLHGLEQTALYPVAPEPIRVGRFVEKRFHLYLEYNPLPEGVLGYTLFDKTGPIKMVISESLGAKTDIVSRRRVNTTIAHEVGHCILHANLFKEGPPPQSLFPNNDEENRNKILCREEHVNNQDKKSTHYDGSWWEYQANMVIGALLLPKKLVLNCIQDYLIPNGTFGIPLLDLTHNDEMIKEISETFDVNPVVARIRIESMFTSNGKNQLSL